MPEDLSLSTLPDITETTAETAATTQPSVNTDKRDERTTNSRKRKHQKELTISQFTINTPTYAYLRLQRLTTSSLSKSFSSLSSSTARQMPPLDATTALIDLRAALSQFLGLHGTSIPIDVLKLQGDDVWIRIPHGDRPSLVAAVGGWMGPSGQGWRVKGWSSWSVGSCDGESAGQHLFTND